MYKKIFVFLFCRQEKHNWEYAISGNRYLAIGGIEGFWDVPVRQCKNCMRFEEKRTTEYEEFEDNYVECETNN